MTIRFNWAVLVPIATVGAVVALICWFIYASLIILSHTEPAPAERKAIALAAPAEVQPVILGAYQVTRLKLTGDASAAPAVGYTQLPELQLTPTERDALFRQFQGKLDELDGPNQHSNSGTAAHLPDNPRDRTRHAWPVRPEIETKRLNNLQLSR